MREEWNHMRRSFRKLLHRFNEEDTFTQAVEYCYGLKYLREADLFFLWDAEIKRSIATIRENKDKAIVRYFEEHPMKNELFKFKIEGLSTIFVRSNNLTAHDDWVRGNLQSRCERAMRERKDFLAEQNEVSSISTPFSLEWNFITGLEPEMLHGSAEVTPSELSTQRVTVYFDSELEQNAQQSEVNAIVNSLIHLRASRRIPRHIMFRDLVELHRRETRRHEAASRSVYYDDSTATFMGRPLEQLQEYWTARYNTSTSSALTEEALMETVRALDEMSVSRETDGAMAEFIARRLRV